MIQRKQTLFLLAVAIINIIQYFIPFVYITLSNDGGTYGLSFFAGCGPSIRNSNGIYPQIISICSLILSIITIFLYKNRVLQYKLANILALLNVFITGLFFLLSYTKPEVLGTISYSFGAFLPIIGAVFAFLAAHFIKKDEQLVRSADRIR